MEGIEFDIDHNTIPPKISQSAGKYSPFVNLVGKLGVTDPTMVNLILLSCASLLFGVAIFIFAESLSRSAISKISSEEAAAQIKVMKQMQQIPQ